MQVLQETLLTQQIYDTICVPRRIIRATTSTSNQRSKEKDMQKKIKLEKKALIGRQACWWH